MRIKIEQLFDFEYEYSFNSNFKLDLEFIEWILKKYRKEELAEKIIEYQNLNIFLDALNKEEYKNKKNFEMLEEIKKIYVRKKLDENLHPYKNKKLDKRKNYLEIICCFISNYKSIHIDLLIELEKISRQLSISSVDIKKMIKNFLKIKNSNEKLKLILKLIEKSNFSEEEKRILKLDFLIFKSFQKNKINSFEKKLFSNIGLESSTIKYLNNKIKEYIKEENNENK